EQRHLVLDHCLTHPLPAALGGQWLRYLCVDDFLDFVQRSGLHPPAPVLTDQEPVDGVQEPVEPEVEAVLARTRRELAVDDFPVDGCEGDEPDAAFVGRWPHSSIRYSAMSARSNTSNPELWSRRIFFRWLRSSSDSRSPPKKLISPPAASSSSARSRVPR